ncbi:MAG: hypothetical protein J2P53_07455 [Bradyrhizobiaceae bacterium]|nr:hypothetical protein [Bradyrhizobiaceae bacterium]
MNDVGQGLRLLPVVLLAAVLCCPGASADATDLGAHAVKREILALYDGVQEGSADATRIHRFAELPLNHLGYILRYRDVRAGLPEPREVAHFAGVLTWFVGPLTDGDAYLAWAERAAKEGPRLVVLGDLGAVVTARNLQLANRVMSRLGLRHTGDYVSPADGSRITRRDPELYEFECRLDPVLADYPIVETDSTEVTIGLQLAVPAHEGNKTSTLVAIGAGGGFAAFNYEFCHQRAPLHRGKWLINPFAFFRAALGARKFPIPDTTTVSGRRIYFSLVDSDGWSVPFDPERGWQAHQIAAEMVARELIEPFPDLAVTLDLRDADILRAGSDPARSRALVERLLALPQVTRPGKRAIGSSLARLDANYDSISNLTPLATAGTPRVILTATGNELAYQTAGTRLPTDLFSLRDTLRRSELPRRLKPANINYHMRIGRERAALNILHRHLELASSADLVPLPAGTYADIVDGFFTAEIIENGERKWLISNRGQLQTVRFDNLGESAVDMQVSRGVIGYTRHGGALYVALDEAVEPVVVALTDASAPITGILDMTLVASRWRVRKLAREANRATFEAEGYGPGDFTWRVPAGTACRVAARRGPDELWAASIAADDIGRLAFTVPVSAATPVHIEIGACKP